MKKLLLFRVICFCHSALDAVLATDIHIKAYTLWRRNVSTYSAVHVLSGLTLK